MRDSLTRLLQIRQLRELTAGTQVNQCLTQFQVCLQRQQQQKTQWNEYRRWRLHQEQGLFKTLQNKPASLRELDRYRAELVTLRERENMLATALRQTEQALENASKALTDARLKLRKAAKAKEKLCLYKAIQQSKVKCQEN